MASSTERSPTGTSGTSSSLTRAHPLGNALVVAALVTSPAMWVIELVAPTWLIYAFRASWVLLVAVAAVVVVRERRAMRTSATER